MAFRQRLYTLVTPRTARAGRVAVGVRAIVAAIVLVAPRWWADITARALDDAGRYWPVLLLLAIASALLLTGPARRSPERRRPEGSRLPLVIHVLVLLAGAVAVAVAASLLLWHLLGQPDVTAPVSVPAPAPPGQWTMQNTFDGMRIVLSVVAGIGAVVALTVAYRRHNGGVGDQ